MCLQEAYSLLLTGIRHNKSLNLVRKRADTHVHIQTHKTHTRTHPHTHNTHVHTRTHTRTHTRARGHARTYKRTYAGPYIHSHTYVDRVCLHTLYTLCVCLLRCRWTWQRTSQSSTLPSCTTTTLFSSVKVLRWYAYNIRNSSDDRIKQTARMMCRSSFLERNASSHRRWGQFQNAIFQM